MRTTYYFYTPDYDVVKVLDVACQCPKRATYHFYDTEGRAINPLVCQCPKRATYHFYGDGFEVVICKNGCQCPKRATYHFYSRPLEVLYLATFRGHSLQFFTEYSEISTFLTIFTATCNIRTEILRFCYNSTITISRY